MSHFFGGNIGEEVKTAVEWLIKAGGMNGFGGSTDSTRHRGVTPLDAAAAVSGYLVCAVPCLRCGSTRDIAGHMESSEGALAGRRPNGGFTRRGKSVGNCAETIRGE